jgi:hypothetical protein
MSIRRRFVLSPANGTGDPCGRRTHRRGHPSLSVLPDALPCRRLVAMGGLELEAEYHPEAPTGGDEESPVEVAGDGHAVHGRRVATGASDKRQTPHGARALDSQAFGRAQALPNPAYGRPRCARTESIQR